MSVVCDCLTSKSEKLVSSKHKSQVPVKGILIAPSSKHINLVFVLHFAQETVRIVSL